MSDYNSIDVIREANAAVVAAAQSSTSFLPALGKEKAKVLVLNLRNRIIFKAADEEGAQESADFLGKKRVDQEDVGVLRRPSQPQLRRARGTQDQTPRSPRPAETHRRSGSLRKRLQDEPSYRPSNPTAKSRLGSGGGGFDALYIFEYF